MPIPVQETVPENVPIGFEYKDGIIIFRDALGNTEYPELSQKNKEKVLSAIHLRETVSQLFQAQRAACSDEELAELQKIESSL